MGTSGKKTSPHFQKFQVCHPCLPHLLSIPTKHTVEHTSCSSYDILTLLPPPYLHWVPQVHTKLTKLTKTKSKQNFPIRDGSKVVLVMRTASRKGSHGDWTTPDCHSNFKYVSGLIKCVSLGFCYYVCIYITNREFLLHILALFVWRAVTFSLAVSWAAHRFLCELWFLRGHLDPQESSWGCSDSNTQREHFFFCRFFFNLN